jgi:hypothetical protein
MVQLIFDLVSVDEEGLIVAFYFEIIDSALSRSLEEQKVLIFLIMIDQHTTGGVDIGFDPWCD